VRDALGDLAVTIVELGRKPTPLPVESRISTFADWYEYGEAFFHQTIDAGLTVARAGRAPTAEELAPLAALFDERLPVTRLFDQCVVAFDYVGYEIGYFYGGAPWLQLCRWRSAGAFIDQFAELSGHEFRLDLSDVDAGLNQWGHELFESLDFPDDMPTSHWWWFHDRSP
jgi:hypothetical protein